MSENVNPPSKKEQSPISIKGVLPPIVDRYTKTGVEWKGLKNIDFDLMGYMLACHLIIEHYIDHFLSRSSYRPYAWDDARLQFSQKLALISKFRCFAPPYDFIPRIKHLNALRNRLAHNINKVITTEDLEPFREWLLKFPSQTSDQSRKIPEQPHKVLEQFTVMVCAWFAGAISGPD